MLAKSRVTPLYEQLVAIAPASVQIVEKSDVQFGMYAFGLSDGADQYAHVWAKLRLRSSAPAADVISAYSILTTKFQKISPLSSPVISSFGSPVNSEKSISNLNPNVDVNKSVKPSQNMQNNQNLQNIQNTEMSPNSLKLIQSMKFLNSPSASELHGKYDMESISFIKDLRRRKSEMSFNVNLIDQSKYVPLRRRSTGDMAENILVLELEKDDLITNSENINENKENVNENNSTILEDEKINNDKENLSSLHLKNLNEIKYIKEIHEIIRLFLFFFFFLLFLYFFLIFVYN